MTNSEGEGCNYDIAGRIRPTFLPLASKKTPYFPTLPGTPEQGGLYDTMVVIRDRDVTQWEMFAPSDYDVNEKSYYDNGDCTSDVFTPHKEILQPTQLCEEKRDNAQAQCEEITRKQIKPFCPQWQSKDDKENLCCSQWLRNYISKLWVKAPVETLPETPLKPKQLTILERELTFKQISPKHLRKLSKKQRHGATSQFIYSFLGVEDTVVELKEERHHDVIYSITVKKDGSLPRSASAPKSLSEFDAMKEKSTSKQIKGATLDFMVEKLARVFAGESHDVNFLNVFLTTYRTFTSPEELFDKLHDEYVKLKSEPTFKNLAVMKSIAKVLRAWLERYSNDDFQDDVDSKLLRRVLALAKIHDDVINKSDVISKEKSPHKQSPLSLRKNGLVYGNCFADYVAAKLVVAEKNKKGLESVGIRFPSPTHNQDPSLNVLEDGSLLNLSPAKMLLNTLSSRYVATQLTVIAAKLFHRVQPHHCLAAVASSKNRPQTVRATIDQFNRVVYCVVGTILCPSLKLSQRTKLLTKWIEVAQECRELKNFSSLRAIVSGLQTYALHRLKRSWMGVLHSHTDLLKELAEINMKDLILKVGTAKVNTEDSAISRVRKEATIRREKDNASGIMHGTVPYLGSFLTDLTYLDTAKPDFIEEGIINFEKRRKEFELLAQLQLWQASCRCYQNLEAETQFLEWFQSVTVLTEDQTFQLSEMIEPQVASPTRKTLSEMIQAESMKAATPKFQGTSKKIENGICVKGHKTSQSFNGRISTLASTPGAEGSAVKIRLVRNKTKCAEEDDIDGVMVSSCEYKKIFISSDDRNNAVIRKALEAYMLDVEANLKRFSLVQVLQDSNKDIQIPETANVFYAMNKSDDEPTLVLLEQGAQIPHKVKRHQSTPVRPKKKTHRKTHSISYATEPESGRSTPTSNVASPMKSLYRQIAFGSMALVGGASYSLTDARRASDGDGDEVAGTGGVVLMNSRPGDEENNKNELHTWKKRLLEMRISLSGSTKSPTSSQRQTRCYSADFTESVLLPNRDTQSKTPLSVSHLKFAKSAPCSPHLERKSDASLNEVGDNAANVVTATGNLRELPRRLTSEYNRSSTWSSRRTMRKPKKTRSMSTFYVNKTSQSSSDEFAVTQSPGTPESKSRFYVGLVTKPPPVTPETNNNAGTAEIYNRSFSSNTLPSKFGVDLSVYDYEVRGPLRGSISLDGRNGEVPLSKFDVSSVRDSTSFASISSSHSAPEVDENSDSASGICFVAVTNEDNVFHDSLVEVKTPNTDSDIGIPDQHSKRSAIAPIIKIHSASPNNLLDQNESGFFDRPSEDTSDADSVESRDDTGENNEEFITYL